MDNIDKLSTICYTYLCKSQNVLLQKPTVHNSVVNQMVAHQSTPPNSISHAFFLPGLSPLDSPQNKHKRKNRKKPLDMEGAFHLCSTPSGKLSELHTIERMVGSHSSPYVSIQSPRWFCVVVSGDARRLPTNFTILGRSRLFCFYGFSFPSCQNTHLHLYYF